MIPLVMDDFKSREWMPPIHTGNYKEKIGKIKCILGIGNVNKNRSRLVKIKNNIKLAKKELRFNGIDLLK